MSHHLPRRRYPAFVTLSMAFAPALLAPRIALAAQGHSRDGTHALELALANLAGIDWRNRK